MRLNFAKTIWWWQFECTDGWTQECITKLGWDVKIQSMQESELLKICVGFFIIWLKPNWEVAISILHSSKVVISFWCKPCILALKSPNTTVRNELLFAMCSKLSSKFLMKFSNSSLVWLGNLQRPTKLHVLSSVLTSKLIRYVYDFRRQWKFAVEAHNLYLKDD